MKIQIANYICQLKNYQVTHPTITNYEILNPILSLHYLAQAVNMFSRNRNLEKITIFWLHVYSKKYDNPLVLGFID